MSKTRQVDFTRGSVVRAMVAFTIPVFFANVFSSLYSIVDATVVGRFVGAHALAAVNASFAINMVLVALSAGLGIGTSIVISQYYGSKRMEDVARAIGTALSTAMTVCCIVAPLGFIFAPQLLAMLNTPADIMADAILYFRIVMVGFVGQLFYGISSGLLRGVGESTIPAICVGISSVLNIVLDVVFVAVFDWGVAGVAWATVIAHYLSGILPISRLLSTRYGYKMSLDSFKIRMAYLKTILRIGVFASLKMMVTSLGMMMIQAFANGFGTDFVAANGVVQKVETFALLPMSTIGDTISTFNGQVRGANQMDRAREGSLKGSACSAGLGLVVGAVLFFAAPLLLNLFISTAYPHYAAVSDLGVKSIRTLCVFYVPFAVQYCLYCILQGAGALRPAVLLTAVGMVLRVALTWLLAVRTGDPLGLYWATNIFYLALIVMFSLYMKFGNVKKYAVVKE